MIFEYASKLKSKSSISLFREKVEVFVNTIEALSHKYELDNAHETSSKINDKLYEMGIAESEEDLVACQRILSPNLYNRFINAVGMSVKYDSILYDSLVKLNNHSRQQLQQKYEHKNALKMVDLFCGAGGLSLGFNQVGFHTVFANDFDPLCIETYKYNHPEINTRNVLCQDIREISDSIRSYIPDTVDLVIGGPPCQGFSSANKHHRVIDDPRNELYKYFIQVVKHLAPKVVVMENVKGMLRVANQVVEDFSNITTDVDGISTTYQTSYKLFNSADFSVSQSRERLIYISIRSDIVSQTSITPEQLIRRIELSNKNKPPFVLADALYGLRPLVAPHTMNVGEIDTEENGRKIDINLLENITNNYINLINSGHTNPLVFNHKARYCSMLNQEIYCRMKPGDDATDPKIADIMPYAHRNDKFKDKYFRLYPDRPCRTITAHMRSDCHSHIHPWEDRTLTPREAARVQSFPDDYLFLGPYLLTYRQIGNAVPPLMARGIAQTIMEFLREDCK